MKCTLLIGNGFDINLGLKTSYNEFLKIYLKGESILRELNEKPKENDENWSDLELKTYLKDKSMLLEFKEKLKEKLKNKHDNWSDLEILLGNIIKEYDDTDIEYYYKGIKDIRNKLKDYLTIEQKKYRYKFSKIKKEWKWSLYNLLCEKSFKLFPCDNIEQMDNSDRIFNIIDFNYTDIIRKMISKVKRKKRFRFKKFNYNGIIQDICGIYHIHGSLKQQRLIFGVSKDDQIKNENFSKDEITQGYILKSKQRSIIKNNIDFNEIIKDSNVIYAFGMSLGESDLEYWEYIYKWLEKDKKRKFIIVKHDSENCKNDIGDLNKIDIDIKNLYEHILESDNITVDKNIISKQFYVIISTSCFNFPKASKNA